MRTCKAKCCKKKFEPRVGSQLVCSYKCYVEYKTDLDDKKWRKEKREMKFKLKTTSSHLQDLQKIFNKYIVLRDKSLPCISCGATEGVRFSAGHYYTTGSYPNLRFDEDNVHKQCWFNCNKNKHGNIAEYTPNLIKKIGQVRFNILYEKRTTPLKLSIPEIQELKTHYRELIKTLNQ